MMEETYPGVLIRAKAIMADAVVIVVFMLIESYIFSMFESVPDISRIIAFLFIFLFYDPLFTSAFGGTFGHMLLGIRVKRETNEQKNILFVSALFRYLVKASLGMFSLLTISSKNKNKAIHDYLVGSVVVFAKLKNKI